jgi:hypothetical protein
MPRLAVICCIFLIVPARQAAAEWHITPMLGLTMLGSTSIVDAELATDNRHWNLGGAVSLLGSGVLGVEVVTLWTPGFFDRDESGGEPDLVAGSRTLSFMGNVVVTAPQRWTEYGLRPFISGGLGLIHVSKTDIPEGIFPVDLNLVGYNIGGGAVGFLTQRTGLRFDFRYHSVLNPSDRGPISIGDVNLRYVTATIGIVFRR